MLSRRSISIFVFFIGEIPCCSANRTLLLVGGVPFNVQVDAAQAYLSDDEKCVFFKKQYSYEKALATILWRYPVLASADDQLRQLNNDIMFGSIDALKQIFQQGADDDVPGYATWRVQQRLHEKKYSCGIMCAKQVGIALVLLVGYWIIN